MSCRGALSSLQWVLLNVVLKPPGMSCLIIPEFYWSFLKGWICTVPASTRGHLLCSWLQVTLGQSFLHMYAWLTKAISLKCKYMQKFFFKGLFYPALVICWYYMQIFPNEQSEKKFHLPLNTQLSFTLFLSSLTISQISRYPSVYTVDIRHLDFLISYRKNQKTFNELCYQTQ